MKCGRIKGIIAFVILIVVCVGTACADDYENIISNKVITLDSSWKDNKNPHIEEGWFIRKEDNTEGEYLIAKETQFLYLTPLYSDVEEMRYYDDAIYTGDLMTCYRHSWFGGSPFYTTAGIQQMKFGYGIKTNNLMIGANIFTAKGGLYKADVLTQNYKVETYDDLYTWIVENGEQYLVGFYDEAMADKGLLLCVFTDATLDDDSLDVHDMLLGHWSGSTAYTQIYLKKDSELYQQAKEAYFAMKRKKYLSYAHAMGLPTKLVLNAEEVVVLSDTENAKIIFSPDGNFVFSCSGKEELKGEWFFSDGALNLSIANGQEIIAEGDPLVLSIEDEVFTLIIQDNTIG